MAFNKEDPIYERGHQLQNLPATPTVSINVQYHSSANADYPVV